MPTTDPNPDESPLPRLDPSAPVLNDVESGLDTPTSAKAAKDDRRHGKKGGGLTAGDDLMEEVPKNNLLIVMPCIGLVLFLAALDQTIIATALPTIAEQFKATPSQYSWVVTSYQLSMTLLTPINGRVSDIVGRKPMLYIAIIEFTVFSAMCGAAKNIEWLIISRAMQGLGGGTIMGLCNIVVSDIVPLEKRGMYQGMLGASWGVSSVLGPILGGVFTRQVSWRWCFYINLPFAGVAFVLLVLTLKLNKPKKSTFADLRRTFDFLGLLLVMIGASLLIVGFSFAADHGFDYKPAIALIAVGGAFMVFTIINCLFTSRIAVIPARMFKTRTTLFYLLASTFQATAFIPLNILLPQFFQGVHGADALQSGVQLLPFAIFVSFAVVVGGQIQSRFRISRPITWAAYALSALGCGLLYAYFNYDIPMPRQHGLLVLLAIGIGGAIQTPLLILQAAMPLRDMAAVTSAWVLTRSLGGSVGVSVLTAVLNTNLRHKFDAVQAKYGDAVGVPTDAAGYMAMKAMPEGPEKNAVLAAFADSFKPCWIVALVLLGVSLMITLPTRSYSMTRARGTAAKAPADTAPGEEESKNTDSGMESSLATLGETEEKPAK